MDHLELREQQLGTADSRNSLVAVDEIPLWIDLSKEDAKEVVWPKMCEFWTSLIVL